MQVFYSLLTSAYTTGNYFIHMPFKKDGDGGGKTFSWENIGFFLDGKENSFPRIRDYALCSLGLQTRCDRSLAVKFNCGKNLPMDIGKVIESPGKGSGVQQGGEKGAILSLE